MPLPEMQELTDQDRQEALQEVIGIDVDAETTGQDRKPSVWTKRLRKVRLVAPHNIIGQHSMPECIGVYRHSLPRPRLHQYISTCGSSC